MNTADDDSLAVALRWDRSLPAPLILASGTRLRADDIIALAREYSIPLVEDSGLAQFLSTREIGSCVPEECWQAIAAVFSFLDEAIQGRWF